MRVFRKLLGWVLLLSALPLAIGAMALEVGQFWDYFLAVLFLEVVLLVACGIAIVGAGLINR